MNRASGAALVFATVTVLSGCDDEPTCASTTTFVGSYAGDIAWNLSGTDSCGMVDPEQLESGTSIFGFIDRSTGVDQRLYVVVQTSTPEVGNYLGRAMFFVADNIWDSGSGACAIEITEYAREDWSLVDFVQVNGVVVCPNPLSSASPDFGELTMTELEFSGHLLDERYGLNLK